jgi:uncharacterized protein with HEPN domain
MTKKSPLALIGHMLDCAQWAVSYIDGLSKADFLEDRRTQQAVTMNLLVIGEMAARLGREHPEFSARHSGAPWQKMTGMRNRIAHGYFELDLEIVWDTVQARLPELIVLVTPIREQLSRDDLIRDARDE